MTEEVNGTAPSEGTVLGQNATPTPAPAAPPVDGAPAAPAITFPDNWREALEEDIRNDPSMKPIPDVPTLAKSYIHAQRAMGKDKITVPSQHATQEEWKQVWNKLGLPESVDKYDITPTKGADVDQNFFNAYKEAALNAGVLPQQAQVLHDWFNEQAEKQVEQQRIENKTIFDKQMQGLKQEWGDAFADNVQRAQAAVDYYGGEDFKEHLNKTGMGNDTGFIKFFAKLGESLKEGQFIDGKGDHSGSTVDESQKTITETLGDSKHPYHIRNHPGHKAAVEEMQRHFRNVAQAKTPQHMAVSG